MTVWEEEIPLPQAFCTVNGKGDPALAIQYAVCHGALAMTTPGDTTMARKEEVEALMRGAGARVLR